MRVALVTVGLLLGLGLFVAMLHLVVSFTYWVSDGSLWGLALLMTIVATPFAYAMAREIVRQQARYRR